MEMQSWNPWRLGITLLLIAVTAGVAVACSFAIFMRSSSSITIDLASDEVLIVPQDPNVDSSIRHDEHFFQHRSICIRSGSGEAAWFSAEDLSVVYDQGRLSMIFVTLPAGEFESAVEQAYRIYHMLDEDTERFQEWEVRCRDQGKRGAPFDQIVCRSRHRGIDDVVVYVRPGYSEKRPWQTMFRIDVRSGE